MRQRQRDRDRERERGRELYGLCRNLYQNSFFVYESVAEASLSD